MQKLAANVQDASKPADILLGVVETVSPLTVRIDQSLVLPASQLLLTSLVSDFEVEMSVDHETEDALGVIDTGDAGEVNLKHKHAYRGEKVFKVRLGLEVGERVIVLQQHGGQQYVILDRAR